MAKLKEADVSFLQLLQRSKDIGGGWKRVSPVLWILVESFPHKELVEIDEMNGGGKVNGGRIRLSRTGKVVVEYLL